MLLNLAPLNYAPMYALPENGGTINTTFWRDEGAYNTNATQVSEKMRQYVALVNSIYNYRTSEEVQISDRFPESSFTIFDVHSLVCTSDFRPRFSCGSVMLTVTLTAERYVEQSYLVSQWDRAGERDFNHRCVRC